MSEPGEHERNASGSGNEAAVHSNTTRTKAFDGSGVLKSTFGASTIITAWLYILGWGYLHSYFAYFGIDLSTLDLSTTTILTGLFAQFVWSPWHAILIGVLVIICFGLGGYGDRIRNPIITASVGIVFLLLFWVGFVVAESNAKTAALRDMVESTTECPGISLSFDSIEGFSDGDLGLMLGSGHLRMLFQSKDALFVFIPIASASSDRRINVVAVDKSKVLATIRTVKPL